MPFDLKHGNISNSIYTRIYEMPINNKPILNYKLYEKTYLFNKSIMFENKYIQIRSVEKSSNNNIY